MQVCRLARRSCLILLVGSLEIEGAAALQSPRPAPGSSLGGVDVEVQREQKISSTSGEFVGPLHDQDQFGLSVLSLGDLNDDGIPDLAVGAPLDDDGGPQRGAVWVLFLNTDGTVRQELKISDTAGGFSGTLSNNDWFGWSLAPLGDLNGDGGVDLAVGALGDDDGGRDPGAVWVLFLKADGTIKEQKISATAGGFSGTLDDYERFGNSLAPLGDLDGDGVADLAVGAPLDDDSSGSVGVGGSLGAVWVLFLNADGTVKREQKISETAGGFLGNLRTGDSFGYSLASLGDLDGDGIADLVTGAIYDDSGGANRGAVWVLFLNADGTVKREQKISSIAGGFSGALSNQDNFGFSLAPLGDLNGDGVADLAVGALYDDDGGPNRGAVWVLFLDADGTVKAEQKISATAGGFQGTLDDGDAFGTSVASLRDLDGNGVADLVTGAYGDDDGGQLRGAVWVLFLKK